MTSPRHCSTVRLKSRVVVRPKPVAKYPGQHSGTRAKLLQIANNCRFSNPHGNQSVGEAPANVANSFEGPCGRLTRLYFAFAQCPTISRLVSTPQQPGNVGTLFCNRLVDNRLPGKDHPAAGFTNPKKEMRILAASQIKQFIEARNFEQNG